MDKHVKAVEWLENYTSKIACVVVSDKDGRLLTGPVGAGKIYVCIKDETGLPVIAWGRATQDTVFTVHGQRAVILPDTNAHGHGRDIMLYLTEKDGDLWPDAASIITYDGKYSFHA